MIIHVDMDAFYAAVEIRDNPDLRGKPVVVGGSPTGRGVVSTANYQARKFGIHSAMPAAKAIRLCPHAIFVKPRMDHYVAISKEIREIFSRFTPLVESISLDEAFLDVAGSEKLFGSAPSIAAEIKKLLKSELGLTASAGVAPNKFVAKVASDLDKPDGLTIVAEDQVQQFLDPLPIRRVWGIGPKTEKQFASLGVSTIAGIRGLTQDALKRKFGLQSDHFWKLSRGLDSRPVVSERDAKSISHETTFPVDIDNAETLQAWLQELMGQVALRLRRLNIKGKAVQLKLRFSDFHTITRRTTLPEYSQTTRELELAARQLLTQALKDHPGAIRLIGAGVSNLSQQAMVQQSLFEGEEKQRDSRIDKACDQLNERFGTTAVRTAAAMEQRIKVHRTAVTEDNQNSQGN